MTRSDRDWALDLYSLFARDSNDDDGRLHYLEVTGEPWSKSRPRFARGGRTYQPRDDREAEERLAWKMRANTHEMFAGNVMLACRFYRSNNQRIDVDNLIKHVCDSANGVWWADDSQVSFVLGEIHLSTDQPRTIILAANHASSLVRGDDRLVPCAHCGQPFLPIRAKSQQQRFCSQPCSHAARTTALAPKMCRQCGGSYKPRTKAQVFCSNECRYASLTAKARAAAAPMSQCEQCGKELAHRRGGRCRDCWRASPNFYAQEGASS